MGEVFLADDTQLGRKVAIKFLPEALEADATARERLRREARSAAALDHPYICKIHEIADIDGRTGIVMEHVAGQTLESRLADGPLAPAEAIQLAAEVVEALSEAHAHRILHRDLKPANLMLTGQGHVKVMDFGLAKRMRDPGVSDSEASTAGNLTRTGTLLGTPAYMAPEQVRGGSVDARSDILSFGVVLFELLIGEHPFKRGTVSDTIAAILRDAPTRATGSGDQVDYAIFDKLLAKTPDDRYQSFDEVSVEVRRLRDATSSWSALASELAGASETPLGGRRTPFVGRNSERAELGRWLDQAVRGRGGLVLIGGEPGVGKTRLVEQLLEVARERHCLALTGRCYEVEGTAPFIPFVEIIEQYAQLASPEVLRETLGDAAPEVARLVPDLRRLIPDLPPPLELPPEQQRHYLFKNIAQFLQRVSRATSTVLLLDDLQWADNATLLLLQHLAPLLARLPLLALGTYRDVELDVNRPFAETLETLNRKRLAQRLNLQRLPKEGVASMLAALGGPSPPDVLVGAIYRETEGNPFFVEEVFQHLEEQGVVHGEDGSWRSDLDLEDLDVPEGVRLVIGRRLERVSADSRKVLTFGAVVGRGFSLDLLEAVGDVTGDALLTALEEAETNHLIVPMSGRAPRWEFSHALIRQTLAAGLSLPRRQRLHLKVADAIERAAGSNAERHASDLAHHLFQAGTAADPVRTLRYLTLAGEMALEQAAAREAMVCFDRGLALLSPDDRQARADLLFKSGQAARSDGTWEVALSRWQEALDLYETLAQGETCAHICSLMVFTFTYLQEWDRALELAPQALRMAIPGAPEEGRLLSVAGAAYANSGDNEQGDECFTRSVRIAEALGDPRVLGQVLFDQLAPRWGYLRIPEMASAGERSVDLVRSVGDLWMLSDGLSLTAIACLDLGRLSDVERIVEEYAPLAERVGNFMALLLLKQTTGPRDLLVAGDLDGFERSAREHRAINDRAGFPWANLSHTFLGLAAMWKGRRVDALAESQQAVEAELPGGPWRGVSCGGLFLCRAFFGDGAAVSQLTEDDLLPYPGQPNTIGRWHYLQCAVNGLALLGRREEAGELYPLTAACLDTGALLINYSFELIQKTAGIAAACGGRWQEAQHHFETALRQAHELPHKIAQPEVRRWYAQMLLDRNASGDCDKARTMLGEAVDMYQQIGMPRHIEMAKEMLHAAR